MEYLGLLYGERLDDGEVERLIFEDKDIALVRRNLNKDEADEIKTVVHSFVRKGLTRNPDILEKCTFFAEFGFDFLEEVLRERKQFANPRIEGDDANSDNQHYWLAFDAVRLGARDCIIVDPIFGFAGLESSARAVMHPEFVDYYYRKRLVVPHKPFSEGGVRIKNYSSLVVR
jgi:hypothetical protein